MAKQIVQFHNDDGTDDLYPKTLTDAVTDANGKTVDELMASIAEEASKNAGSSFIPEDMELLTASGLKNYIKLNMQGPEPTKILTTDKKEYILCQPAGFKVYRKTDSYPTGPDDPDATLVIDVPYSDNTKYATDPYIDSDLEEETAYYYQAFPYTENGKYNVNEVNRVTTATRNYVCYGYRVVQDSTKNDNGIPSKMIQEIPEPLYTLGNTGFTPMKMDYSAGKMNYGSWTGEEFLFPKSCAVNSDTTVAYYIDENDNTKKVDGTTISDQLNKMVEFGRDDHLIWERYVNSEDGKNTDVYLSDTKIDDNFKAWPFIRSDGSLGKHFYLPKYDGYTTGGKMLSITGVSPSVNTTAYQERTNASANNTSGDDSWGLVTKAMWDLYGDILLLLGMSTDTQTVFGYGYANGNSDSIQSGTMNIKGMFWGENGGKQGVKVLGIENPWGNIWRRIDGWNQGASGHTLIKLCKGTSDGSTTADYNDSGSGYIDINDAGQGVSGYISEMKYDERGFRYPIACAGAET